MALSEDFSVRAPNIALTISTMKPTENDDSEACDGMLLFGHSLGRDGVK